MAITQKQLAQLASIIYLILATALSSYATARSIQFSLPIPRSLAYSTTALPLLSALLLELSYVLTGRQERRKQRRPTEPVHSPWIIVANVFVIIYSTVVITLLGTRVIPSPELNCGLRDHWTSLFRQKNEIIRTIQDRLQCCGLQNGKDMSWPFPNKNHPIWSCEIDFGRTQGCFNGWRNEEQHVAGIFLAVVGLVSLWQSCSILIRIRREPWLHQIVPGQISRMIADRRDDNTGNSRRRIGYTAGFDQYSDEAEGDNNDISATENSRRTLDGVAYQGKSSPDHDLPYEDPERVERTSA